MINEKTAKLISKEERYPDGANSPTLHYVYECACGKGRVERVRVIGFHDEYTQIECRACAKRYEIRSGFGYAWEFVKKGE
jgi:hypothetical protein